jgi:anti-anti-sigma factor
VVARLEYQVGAQVASAPITDVIVDIGAVSFIDSAGIGALVACRRRADDVNKNLTVLGAQGRVADVLKLTGVLSWLSSETHHTPTAC